MATQSSNINPQYIKSTLKRFVRIIIPTILLTLLLAVAAKAQERALTLDEALKIGLQYSNVIRLSKAKVDQAVSQYNQAKDQVKPTGKATFGYDRAEIPANRLAFGDESFSLPKNADAWLGTVSLTQVIF